jgi:hypothetical protein
MGAPWKTYLSFSDGNGANIAIWRTDADAKRADAAYRAIGSALGGSVNDILQRLENVTIVWMRLHERPRPTP